MCYLVTGVNVSGTSNTVGRFHTIYDLEEDARQVAEGLVNKDYTEVTVWKQVGVPKVSRTVSWE